MDKSHRSRIPNGYWLRPYDSITRGQGFEILRYDSQQDGYFPTTRFVVGTEPIDEHFLIKEEIVRARVDHSTLRTVAVAHSLDEAVGRAKVLATERVRKNIEDCDGVFAPLFIDEVNISTTQAAE